MSVLMTATMVSLIFGMWNLTSAFPWRELKHGLIWPENTCSVSFWWALPGELLCKNCYRVWFPACKEHFHTLCDFVEWHCFNKILLSWCGYIDHGSLPVCLCLLKNHQLQTWILLILKISHDSLCLFAMSCKITRSTPQPVAKKN